MNPAGLAIDLEDLWALRRRTGDPAWRGYPGYLDRAVPPLLQILAERDLRATFLVCGLDASLARNEPALQAIVAAGHEIGNATFHRDPFTLHADERLIENELSQAEHALVQLSGRRPTVFAGAAEPLSPAVLRVLARRGYRLEARLGSAIGTLRTFRWSVDERSLLAVPLTVAGTARIRLPLEVTAGSPPAFTLHPLNVLGRDDDAGLADESSVAASGAEMRRKSARLLDRMVSRYTVRPLGELAAILVDRDLSERDYATGETLGQPPWRALPFWMR